jgi:hypothetical protein
VKRNTQDSDRVRWPHAGRAHQPHLTRLTRTLRFCELSEPAGAPDSDADIREEECVGSTSIRIEH